MASRRTRIKGIANIPQRRKPCANSDEQEALNVTNLENTEEVAIISKVEITENNSSNNVDNIKQEINNCNNDPLPEVPSNPVIAEQNTTTRPIIKPRHRFLKPKPSLGSACRNLKDISSSEKFEVKHNVNTSNLECKSNLVVEENSCKSTVPIQDNTFLVPKSTKFETEVTLNETQLLPSNQSNNNQQTVLERGIKRLIPINVNNINVPEPDYPPPPHSPSKINRSRIKATPRLGQRRTSFSASESEDESRKYSRNRNDSVCSTASGIQEILPSECMSPQRQTKEYNSVIQRKCRRSEQSRKLAEARREFQLKFGSNTPNRSKLTMIDLIFYNPTTNPMPHIKQRKDSVAESIKSVNEEDNAENIDDPTIIENNNNTQSDEENDNPAPQIKIGPQGELIVDEKSLVIESKKTKQNRQELQKSSLVDGDFETGYGIYKRSKRSKDWNKMETLRFYKALNTIGTDFTLMCELFPERERRELKQKFKKEERLNRALIDKAITQPCGFDFDELLNDIAMEEEEMKERERFNEIKRQEVKRRRLENAEHARKQKAAALNEKSVKPVEKTIKTKPPLKDKKPKIKRSRIKSLSISSILESDADESDIEESEAELEQNNDQNSDVEVIVESKPTRSGRIPKTVQKYEPTHNSTFNRKRKLSSDDSGEGNVDENIEKYEPGSLMICCNKGPNGEPQYQFYMVTSNQNKTPIDINPSLMSSLTKMGALSDGMNMQNLFTITARQNVSNESDSEPEENIIENNCTIPAEENNFTIPHEENNYTIPADDNNFTAPAVDNNTTTYNENNDNKSSVELQIEDKKNEITKQEIVAHDESDGVVELPVDS